jgi:hypothetical protein
MLDNPVFIKVPSVHFVKLPTQWLNLAQIRQIKRGDVPGKIVVVYDTGEFDIFEGSEAMQLLDAIHETKFIDKSE